MKRSAISLLECPICHADFTWQGIFVIANSDPEIVWEGLLHCNMGHDFMVEHGCAMLRIEDQGRETMMRRHDHQGPAVPRSVEIPTNPDQQAALLTPKIRARLPWKDATTDRARKRLENDLAYRVHSSKKKYLPLLPPSRPFQTVCDLGVGQGGFLTDIRNAFSPQHAIGVEYDPAWAEIAALRDPETSILVADGRALPLKNRSIDLLVSVYALEHIPEWRTVVAEIERTAGNGLLLFGPNKWFPFDIGHAPELPFLPMLPLGLRVPLLYLSKKIVHTPQPYQTVLREQTEMTYIASREFEESLRAHHFAFRDCFLDFADVSLANGLEYWKGLRWIRRFAPLVRAFLKILHRFRMHPIHAYQITHYENSPRQ